MRQVKYVLALTGTVLATSSVVSGRCDAQILAAMEPHATQQMARTTDAILAKPVTVHLEGVSLKRAIDAAAASAKVRVSYSLSVVEAYTAPVSLRMEEKPLGDIFERIFKGTALKVVGIAGGQLAVVQHEAEQLSVANGVIIGRVLHSKTKQPVAGAAVIVDDAAIGVTTDANGAFRVNVASGEHNVAVRLIGYSRAVKRVSVSGDQTVTVDVLLDPSASVLDEVVVTGTVIGVERKTIPTPITVITAADIEQRGITRIEELFRGEVPGVVALDEGVSSYYADTDRMTSSQVYVRGSSGIKNRERPQAAGLKTYVDGVELLDPSRLGTIAPNTIERIEIVTGPQAATIYGSGALGGVMMIFTKKGNSSGAMELNGRFKYGMLANSLSSGLTPTHSHALTLNGGTGPSFTYSGTLSYNYTGQWQPKLFSQSIGSSIGVNSQYKIFTLSGSITTTKASNGSALGLHEYYRFRNNLSTGEAPNARPAENISQSILKNWSQGQSVSASFSLGRISQHTFTFGRSADNSKMVPEGPRFRQPYDSAWIHKIRTGSRMTASHSTTFMGRNLGHLSTTLTLGGDASWGEQMSVEGYTASKDATMFTMWSGVGTQVTIPVTQESYGGYGSWRLTAFDQLTLTLGLRAEHNANYGDKRKIDWTPSNGLAWNLSAGALSVKVLGSYGRATRPPEPFMKVREYYPYDARFEPHTWITQIENPDLRPEKSSGPQGGVELYFGNRGSVEINTYQQVVRDLIQNIVLDSAFYREIGYDYEYKMDVYGYRNTAKIKQYGWTTNGTLNAGFLTFRGTYSWMESRVVEVSDKDLLSHQFYPGMSFLMTPSHTGNIRVTYAHRGTSITVSNNFAGRRIQYNNSQGLSGGYGYSYVRFKHYYDGRIAIENGKRSAPGWAKSAINVSQRLSSTANFTLDVANLENRYTSDSQWYAPTLGRTVNLGLSMRLMNQR